MGWVMMSERELNRVEVLAQVDDGRLSVDNAANMLAADAAADFRLLKRYRQDGASAIRHKSRGRACRTTKSMLAKRDYALSLDQGSVSRISVRHWLLRCWPSITGSKSRARRCANGWSKTASGSRASNASTFHQPRLRRECFGELIQIDGSDHRWFEDRAPALAPCSSSSTTRPAP